MKHIKTIQISITVSAVAIAIVHLIWPGLKIDSITLALVIIAIVPWLTPLFKSLEFPGGLKFEFQELERVKKKAEAAGLVDDKLTSSKNNYAFMEIADSNPRLALAGLRIELEKSLKTLDELYRKEGIAMSTRSSISLIIRDLYGEKVITSQERAALADMIGTLNRAVHGEELDYRAAQWVIDVGPKILESISRKIKKAEKIV